MKYSIRSSLLKTLISLSNGCSSSFRDDDPRRFMKIVFGKGKVVFRFYAFGILSDTQVELEQLDEIEEKNVVVLVNDIRGVFNDFGLKEQVVDFYIEDDLNRPRIFICYGSLSKNSIYGRKISLGLNIFPDMFFRYNIPEWDKPGVELFQIRSSILKECLCSLNILNTKKSNHDADYVRFGIHVSGEDSRINMIGLDGTRLIKVSMASSIKNIELINKGFTMFTSIVNQLLPLSSFIPNDIMICSSIGTAGFKDFLVWSCVVDGVIFRIAEVFMNTVFPDVSSIFNTEKSNTYIVNKNNLFDAVKRILPLTQTIGVSLPGVNDVNQSIKVGGVLNMKQISQEEFDFRLADRLSTLGFVFGMKGFYITDVLQKIEEDEVIIEADNGSSSVFITPLYKGVNNEVEKKFILMPLNLNVSN